MSSPIDQLPTELLARVFSAIISSIDRFAQPARNHPLLPARLVSRRWDTIATSTPSLWTTVWIGKALHDEDDEDNLSWKPIIAKQLERAGETLPLDIILHFEADVYEAYDVLKPYASRWATITFPPIDEPYDSTYPHVFLSDSPMPNLRELNIQTWSADYNVDIKIDAPKLEKLVCLNQRITFPSDSPAPPLRIVDLKGGFEEGGGSMELETLSRCRETVEYLSLKSNWDEDAYSDNLDLTFPRLHTLRLSEWSTPTSFFLNRASFPSLQTLHVGWFLETMEPPTIPSSDNLPPFQEYPRLRELEWEGTSPEKISALRTLLASTPNLETLSVASVDALTGSGGPLSPRTRHRAKTHPTLCPNLRELRVGRASAAQLDVLAADPERSALKVIFVAGEVHSSDVKMLKRVRERGVEVRYE